MAPGERLRYGPPSRCFRPKPGCVAFVFGFYMDRVGFLHRGDGGERRYLRDVHLREG